MSPARDWKQFIVLQEISVLAVFCSSIAIAIMIKNDQSSRSTVNQIKLTVWSTEFVTDLRKIFGKIISEYSCILEQTQGRKIFLYLATLAAWKIVNIIIN